MHNITMGNKEQNFDYDFRETCFGICYIDNKFYLTGKKGEIYLPGGGIAAGESLTECLKREFMEEIGCKVIETSHLCTIDCFWITRDNRHMESLTHIYIVKISDNIQNPLELNSKLIKLKLNETKLALELPYHKKALEIFTSNLD